MTATGNAPQRPSRAMRRGDLDGVLVSTTSIRARAKAPPWHGGAFVVAAPGPSDPQGSYGDRRARTARTTWAAPGYLSTTRPAPIRWRA